MNIAKEAARINYKVNSDIVWTREPKGKNEWQSPEKTLDLKKGDCEDMAVLKMAILRELGITNTYIIRCWTEGTPRVGHAMLCVPAKVGWCVKRDVVLVLDNNSDHMFELPDVIDGHTYYIPTDINDHVPASSCYYWGRVVEKIRESEPEYQPSI